MRIDLIFPAYPPFPHAIGEYTSLLAATLREEGVTTRVICSQELSVAGAVLKAPVSEKFIDGVNVAKGFSLHRPEELVATIQSDPPTVAILQYCPFSWGIRGRCPGLMRAWRELARTCPSVCRIVMFHELWTETGSWKARLMKIYQKAQAVAVARSSDANCFSCDRWYRKMKRFLPDHQPTRIIPVGTNIPVHSITPSEARERLGIPESAPVLGVMGTGHPSRRFDLVAAAFQATVAVHPNARLLYIGPDRKVLAEAFGGEDHLRNLGVIADGWADDLETSKRLAAIDVYLCPFSDGVSCRRGSFITGLAHGLTCLTTRTSDTDLVLIEAAESGRPALHLVDVQDRHGFIQKAIALAGSRRASGSRGNDARELYQRVFAWTTIANSFIEVIQQLTSGRDIQGTPLGVPT